MTEAVKLMAKPKSLVQWVLIAVLAVLVAIAALPHYFSGAWPWSTALPVPQLSAVKQLNKASLPLAGWEASQLQEVRIGGNNWALTEYRPATSASDSETASFALLLRPQTAPDRQPEVEWIDLQGSQGWRVHDAHTVRFTVADANGQSIPISARYFRGLNASSTLAVMQWYAWPTGGHFAPGKWFWADQVQQWQQRERLPWVAVSILLPIEPVGDIRPHSEKMVAIAQAIQTSLLTTALQSSR